MDYVERYVRGEYGQVWKDLLALGNAVHEGPVEHAALEVAHETMRRVRRNCQRVVDRLAALGYEFGVYPDGSTGYYTHGPLVGPRAGFQSDQLLLARRFGSLPMSLTAFWEDVGSVDLVGRRQGWPRLLDPLVVYPPEAIVSDLDSMEVDERGEFHPPAVFEGGLAPDFLHKDNISGGAPYAVVLPDPAADFILLNERHGLPFVEYLRLAILQWGGLPGLDGRQTDFEGVGELVRDLEPF